MRLRGLWLPGLCCFLLLFSGMASPSVAQEAQRQVFLPLLARPRSPETLFIVSIQPGNPTGSVLDIWVLGGENSISVTARVADHVTTMSLEPYECTRGGCNNGWHGTLSMEGLPRGEYRLVVEAIDPLGRVAETEQRYFYDQLPHLTIHAPERFDTATPTLHLHATCTDDSPGGCQSIEVRTHGPHEYGTLITRTQGSILSETVSLAPWTGQMLGLTFIATDSTGRSTDDFSERSPVVSVFVPPASLKAITEVPGLILDADATRILYLGDLPPRIALGESGTLLLYDDLTGQTTRIQEDVPISSEAKLFSQGVIFTPDYYIGASHHLYEWRYGQVHDLGPLSPDTLRVRGEYAGWHTGWQAGSSYLLRDLRAGSNQVVFTPQEADACTSYCTPDLATNGDVVYTHPDILHHLFRYRQGVTTQLTPPAIPWYSTEPRTDGVSIVYRKSYPEPDYHTHLMLLGPSDEIELTVPPEFEAHPWVSSFAINNGWVAATTEVGIWIRSPDGTQTTELLSPSAMERVIDIGPTGATIHASTFHTYLLRPGPESPSIYLHSTTGRVLWRDAEPLLAIGNTIFEINAPNRAALIALQKTAFYTYRRFDFRMIPP